MGNTSSFYGVFDGHGDTGHDVSDFVKEMLPKLLLKDERFHSGDDDQLKKALHDQFLKTHTLVAKQDQLNKIDAKFSGTTATLCVHDLVRRKFTIAHVADSTAVLGTYDDERQKLKPTTLTRDHKPDLEDERARVESTGAAIEYDGYNHRIYHKLGGDYPGLNMSRSLGDLKGHIECGVSAEPEIMEHEINDNDHVLLLCSDGIWEFMSKDHALRVVQNFPAEKAKDAAEALAKESWDLWMEKMGGAVVDDITVVLVYLQKQVVKGSFETEI